MQGIITYAGKLWLLERIIGGPASPVEYLAIGDGVASPAYGDTTLQNERFRKAIDPPYRDGGLDVFEVTIGFDEANFHWREGGLFAGGTISANTGILISRFMLDEAKDSLRTVHISVELGLETEGEE